ncbi:hypothetical protein DICA1_D17876 [Diutina catenulata]
MKIQSLIAYLAVSSAAITTLTSSKIENRKGMAEIGVDDVYIYHNTYWSLINNQLTRFSNQFKVYDNAAYYDSSVPGKKGKQVVSSTFRYFYNWGLTVIHSPESTSEFNYEMHTENVFYNKGWMFLGGDGGSEKRPFVNLKSGHWENWGAISMYQNSGPQGNYQMGLAGRNALNAGSICLHNFVFTQMNKVYGSGCIRVGENSLVHIKNHADPIYVDQTIVLDSANAHILTTNYNSKYTYNVAGFGKGNYIASEGEILHFNYDSDKGILTIYHDQAKQVAVSFKIGKGYLPTQFKIATAELNGVTVAKNAIKYSGTVPLSATPIPKNYCPGCPVRPEQPGYTAPAPKTTLTTVTSDPLPTNGGDKTTVTLPTGTDGKPEVPVPTSGVTTLTLTKDPEPLPEQTPGPVPSSCVIEYVTATVTATEYYLVLECPSCT